MILSNLARIIPFTLANEQVSLPATCGGKSKVQDIFSFYIGETGANSYIPLRMQKYNANSQPDTGRYPGLNTLICVGNGTTPPTADDVKLENAILDLDYNGGICALNKQTITVTTTWQNNTGAPITINELGIHLSEYLSGSITEIPFVILTRSVLEQPVVMQDGESRTFSIAINFGKMLETSTNGE